MTLTHSDKQAAIDQHSVQADQFAGRYRSLETEPYRNCFNYSRHQLERVLAKYLPADGSGLSLLDVGCGTGHHLARLRERGYNVAGVDGSAEMLEHARRNNPGCELRAGDVDALPFEDNRFDVTLCVEVLRYLADPQKCVNEMARVLRPGGVCITTAAPLLSLNGYWLVNRLAGALPVKNLVRLRQYFTTMGRLRRQFRAAGFRDVVIEGVYYGPINWMERLCPGLLPRCLRAWERVDTRLSEGRVLRELSNMFLVRAVKGFPETQPQRHSAAEPQPQANH
jgi:ubiquinone/menaquinone biosynthesis C-methylase UbiE